MNLRAIFEFRDDTVKVFDTDTRDIGELIKEVKFACDLLDKEIQDIKVLLHKED